MAYRVELEKQVTIYILSVFHQKRNPEERF
jgi:hypothetical protein